MALRLHWRVLSPTQRVQLRTLSPLAAQRGFYLAGGTGLALQLGHRRSVDFDWFTRSRLADPLQLSADLQASGAPLVVESSEKGTLHARLRGVRVSFLEYRYRLLRPLLVPGGAAPPLASLEDIACMKLAAIAQRGARKDFIDVYALGQRFTLAEMLSLYQRKYAIPDIGHLLVALSFFDDADREPMPRLLLRWSWPAIKKTFKAWVRDLAG